MAEYHNKIMIHDHNGIKVLDNYLPRWWLALFFLTIVWSILYMSFCRMAEFKSSYDDSYLLGTISEYHSPFYNPRGDATPRMAAILSAANRPSLLTFQTDTNTYEAVTDPIRLSSGQDLYMQHCWQCHGKLGEGGVGPNMVDDYWLHGNGITNIVKSATYGYPAKGMIAWRGTLSAEEIIDVSSFLLTLHGTNPPNARPPQGELIKDEI